MIIDTTQTKVEFDFHLAHVREQLEEIVLDPNLTITSGYTWFASVHTTENWDKATERREKYLAAGESENE